MGRIYKSRVLQSENSFRRSTWLPLGIHDRNLYAAPSRVNWALLQGSKVRFTGGGVRVGVDSQATVLDL